MTNNILCVGYFLKDFIFKNFLKIWVFSGGEEVCTCTQE